MAFQIECKCGKNLDLHNKMKGKKFRCPYCGLVISLKIKSKPKPKLPNHARNGDSLAEDIDGSQPVILVDDSQPMLIADNSENAPPKKKKPPELKPRQKKKKIVYDEVEVIDYDDVEIIEDN